MTRGQLVTRVARKFSLNTDSGSDELALLQDWANEGAVEVLRRTHCYVEIGDMALTAGQDTYRTDSILLAVLDKRITSNSQNYHFDVVPMETILDAQRGVGSGTYPSMVAFEGTLMMLYPKPATADTIRFIYVPVPSPMTDDAHDPSAATYGGIPSYLHRVIEYYMDWQAAEYDDKAAPMSPRDYHDVFLAECAQARKDMRAKRGRTLSPVKVGYPGGTRYPSRNDTYPAR